MIGPLHLWLHAHNDDDDDDVSIGCLIGRLLLCFVYILQYIFLLLTKLVGALIINVVTHCYGHSFHHFHFN